MWFVLGSSNHPHSRLPEITVGVDDPHSKALHPFLLCCNPLVAAEHAQGELVDTRLEHGAKLLLEVCGLILQEVLQPNFGLSIDIQGAFWVCCVVIIVGLDQGEERLGNLTSLCLWRRGGWRCRPLGAASPSWETEAVPAAVPGDLRFVSWTFPSFSLFIYTPRRACHFCINFP